MLAWMQTDIIGRRVWLFYNAIGAVAQCPYNWGVGSAFHPMKIHIYFEYDRVEKQVKFCKSFPKSNNYLEKPLSTKNSSNRPKQTEK